MVEPIGLMLVAAIVGGIVMWWSDGDGSALVWIPILLVVLGLMIFGII